MSENSWENNNTTYTPSWQSTSYTPSEPEGAAPVESPAEEPVAEARSGLESAASSFTRNVSEATERLSSAAEQFTSMAEGLALAVEDARKAADEAREAKAAAEAVSAKMAADYGSVSELVRDLQERIAALAVLARPMPATETPSLAEAASEETPEAPASTYSWQGQVA